jgi:hypothetical protein
MAASTARGTDSSSTTPDITENATTHRKLNELGSAAGSLVMGSLTLAGLVFGFHERSVARDAAREARHSLTKDQATAVAREASHCPSNDPCLVTISTDDLGYKKVTLAGSASGFSRTMIFEKNGDIVGTWPDARVLSRGLLLVAHQSSDPTRAIIKVNWDGSTAEIAHVPAHSEVQFLSLAGLHYAAVGEGVITLDKGGSYSHTYESLDYNDLLGIIVASKSGLQYCLDPATGAPSPQEGFVGFWKSTDGHNYGERKNGIRVRV